MTVPAGPLQRVNLQHMRTPSLPMMSGPPLKLMIDPEATPFAYHTPVPVPLHWRADAKAGLDCDVLLGVIEPVPVGEPVTWCHRMVVCAKKDGKPRRTVDFQPLNKHATRETLSHRSTRRDPCRNTRRNPCLMRGMDTTVWRYAKRIVP